MKKFITQLKNNRIQIFIAWNLIVLCMFLYWVITDGWEYAKQDILLGSIILLTVGAGYIIGEVIVYFKNQK